MSSTPMSPGYGLSRAAPRFEDFTGINYNSRDVLRQSSLAYSSELDWDADVETATRHTGIICTIGPCTKPVPILCELLDAGMNIVRLNFSHGSHEFHGGIITNAREAAQQRQRLIAIALDTKGPEIRTGLMNGGEPITYTKGTTVKLSVNPEHKACADQSLLYADYVNLPKILEKGSIVFVDDGLLALEVTEIAADYVMCTVNNTALLGERKGINLPGADVDLPAMSEQDKRDLKFGVEQMVDIVFASFIRTAQDVRDVRAYLESCGAKPGAIQIISKIESKQGLKNFPAILKESDGIMVARGDLGMEIAPKQGLARVFLAQKMMISACNIAGKPVICATQMLESMVTNPRPTRAEVSDVANAVLDGADCVMLSGETAKGAYPVPTVEVMNRISQHAERSLLTYTLMRQIKEEQGDRLPRIEVTAQAGVATSYEIHAQAIIVLTLSGSSARLIAKYRPKCPIYAVCHSADCDAVARALLLNWGVFPIVPKHIDDGMTDDELVHVGIQAAKDEGRVKAGDDVVAVHADKYGGGHANVVRCLTVQ